MGFINGTISNTTSNNNTNSSVTIKNGTYFIETALKSGMVMDVDGASKNDGGNIHIWSNGNGDNQKFKIEKSGNYYIITAVHSGKVVDVSGGSTASGTNVQQWTSNNTNAQKWKLIAISTQNNITNRSVESLCFDYKYYANTYSDLKATFGYNESSLRNHWLTYGIKEGRSGSPILDLKYYVKNNGDLKAAFGTDYKQAYQHFLNYGCSEGRTSSPYYSADYYHKKYSDLANFDNISLINHYVQYGINEGRSANTKKYTPASTSTTTPTSSNIIINGVDIGYATGQYFSKNGKACTCHNQNKCAPERNGCNCNHVNGTAQCYAFALWCQNKLYGFNDVSNPDKFKNIGSVAAGKLTASKLKSLINAAPIGAHIRTKGSQHSMVLIAKDANGFTVAQANGSNNNEYKSWSACRIGTATYTWNSYVKSTYGSRGISFIKTPR